SQEDRYVNGTRLFIVDRILRRWRRYERVTADGEPYPDVRGRRSGEPHWRHVRPAVRVDDAEAMLERLRARWASVQEDDRRFVQALDGVEGARVFDRYPPGEPYGDMNALCLAQLGVSLGQARELVA